METARSMNGLTGQDHPTSAAHREMRRVWGRQTTHQLGQLLLINAIQAGMRVADGNKYIPAKQGLSADSSETRARIRLLLPEFLHFASQADAEPDLVELIDQPWQRIWHDPLVASQLALALLPHSNQARLTHAVNQLRQGMVKPARANLQNALADAPLRSAERSRFQRNLAACYELLGDDEGAHWFAERAVDLCPWDESNLLSYLIYAVIAPDAGKRIPKIERTCQAFSGPFPAKSIWSILAQQGGRATEVLNADLDLARRIHQILHHA
jgi:hypothetical protein